MALIIYILALILLVSLALGGKSLAPWVPSRSKDLKRILDLAELRTNDVFYDLGCGNGKVNSFIAKNSDTLSVGIEIGIPLYIACLTRKIFLRNNKLIFKFGNFYRFNLSEATVVFLFATESKKIGEKLKLKLINELKPGSRIISYAFAIEGWEPEKVDKPTHKDVSIYLYKINQ